MRRRAVVAATLLVATASACGRERTPAAGSADSAAAGEPITVFSAGSLARPMRAALDSFARHTGTTYTLESAGSLELARRLTDLGKSADLVALADEEVFPRFLMPGKVTWYARFARNRLVLAYGANAKRVSEAEAGDWRSVLQRPEVETGRAAPDLDPAGYRTLMLFQLAERHYAEPGLARRLEASAPRRNMRPKSAELVALLQSNEIDYAWMYESSARGARLSFVAVPPDIDLGDERLAAAYGAARVRPVKVQKERVFAQRSGTQLVAIQYAEENDSFGAEDISILSEHLFTEGVVEIAYQRRPVPSLYCVLESGELTVGTIDRNQNILGWAPWETDGAVESICSIPRGKTDEVWVVVRRTVNGATVRYVERFEESFEALYGQTGFDYGYTVDCATAKASATAFTTISGLSHLEGESVSVLADGYNAGTYTVASGEITLATPAKKAIVGKGFSALLEPMPPEMPTQAGSARGRQVRATEATVLVHRSLGGKINGVPLPARAFGPAVLDQPPPLVTGERRIDGLSGWERGEPLVRIEQDEPLPMHVLAIVQKLVVNP